MDPAARNLFTPTLLPIIEGDEQDIKVNELSRSSIDDKIITISKKIEELSQAFNTYKNAAKRVVSAAIGDESTPINETMKKIVASTHESVVSGFANIAKDEEYLSNEIKKNPTNESAKKIEEILAQLEGLNKEWEKLSKGEFSEGEPLAERGHVVERLPIYDEMTQDEINAMVKVHTARQRALEKAEKPKELSETEKIEKQIKKHEGDLKKIQENITTYRQNLKPPLPHDEINIHIVAKANGEDISEWREKYIDSRTSYYWNNLDENGKTEGSKKEIKEKVGKALDKIIDRYLEQIEYDKKQLNDAFKGFEEGLLKSCDLDIENIKKAPSKDIKMYENSLITNITKLQSDLKKINSKFNALSGHLLSANTDDFPKELDEIASTKGIIKKSNYKKSKTEVLALWDKITKAKAEIASNGGTALDAKLALSGMLADFQKSSKSYLNLAKSYLLFPSKNKNFNNITKYQQESVEQYKEMQFEILKSSDTQCNKLNDLIESLDSIKKEEGEKYFTKIKEFFNPLTKSLTSFLDALNSEREKLQKKLDEPEKLKAEISGLEKLLTEPDNFQQEREQLWGKIQVLKDEISNKEQELPKIQQKMNECISKIEKANKKLEILKKYAELGNLKETEAPKVKERNELLFSLSELDLKNDLLNLQGVIIAEINVRKKIWEDPQLSGAAERFYRKYTQGNAEMLKKTSIYLEKSIHQLVP